MLRVSPHHSTRSFGTNAPSFFIREMFSSFLKGYCSSLLFNQISATVQGTDTAANELYGCFVAIIRRRFRRCFDHACEMRCTMNFVMCQSNKCTLTSLSLKHPNNNLFCCNAPLSVYFAYRTSFYGCIKINTHRMLFRCNAYCHIKQAYKRTSYRSIEHIHRVTFNLLLYEWN